MIEIIKKGTKKVTNCKFCGCEFSYEEEDLKWLDYQHDKFVNGMKAGYKKYVICPQCEKEVVVEQTK